MPIYDYECDDCKKQFEAIRKITDENPVECPECHKTNTHRLISHGTNFILKGDGWFSTEGRKHGDE